MRRKAAGQLEASPPGVDDHIVGDAAAGGVMQSKADDTVIVRAERPGGNLLAGPMCGPGEQVRGLCAD